MGESKVARRFEHRWRASLSHGAPICGDAHQTSTEVVGAVLGKVGPQRVRVMTLLHKVMETTWIDSLPVLIE